ncbi:membrane protein-like protein [Asticcacaulis biprosthecium C19]|uniref:Membrane protein-like protein n=1 Tax=Asticcacaulis biprosthecium C19 TaxID=715226 RepID=F4QTE7_9CAUL|nr:MgtC/SapB family protein [Asticcacaulis biprosthecium]EGF90017.1 membrane protein-like protein [Asticcacaulis biprosthecium C19]
MTVSLGAPLESFEGVVLALGLGLLIGIERGWSRRDDPDGSRVAGIRTFGLLGFAGGIAGRLADGSQVLSGIIVIATAAALVTGYARHARASGNFSATSTIAGLVTLAVGLCAGLGEMTLAAISAALMTVLLSSRRQLHGWLSGLNESEVQAIARFAVISLAVLPLLPDADFGPFGAWNPRHIWMVVVLVSGLSFAGYMAGKLLGPSRGILATAAAGAVVSSTAVTVALSSRIRHGEGQEAVLVAGIAIASAVMFLRVLILTALLAPFALPSLGLLVAPAAMTGVVCAVWLIWRSRAAPGTVSSGLGVRNPFDLWPALFLAALVAVLSLAARWLLAEIGEAGLAIALAISGMVDVDSAIITMGSLPDNALPGTTAGLILAAPVMLNTLVKTGVAIVTAGGRNGWRAATPLLLSLAAGLAGAPFLFWHP